MAETDRDRSTRARRGASEQDVREDAIALLKSDHRAVERLFDLFEGEDDPEERAALATRICHMLRVHTEIEEAIFYPAARAAAEDSLLDEAQVEHDTATLLIEQIERMGPTEPLFAARVKILGEYVKHHVHEEENELFEQVRDGELDLDDLGAQMSARKKLLEQAIAPS